MIPTTLFAKRTKVNLVIGCSGIWWGIAAASTAAVNSYGTAMAARYFVGFGEAGFGPVIPFYLARWYTKRDLALRMSIFLFSGPLAGVINGLVSYGVSFIKGSLAPWRILFIIEGCPAILAGVFALSILPGDVTTTRWLTEKERACGEFSAPVLLYVLSHPSQSSPGKQGKLLLSPITSTGDRQLVSYGAGKSFCVSANRSCSSLQAIAESFSCYVISMCDDRWSRPGSLPAHPGCRRGLYGCNCPGQRSRLALILLSTDRRTGVHTSAIRCCSGLHADRVLSF